MQYGELETPFNFNQHEHDGSVEYDIYNGIYDNNEPEEIEDIEIPF